MVLWDPWCSTRAAGDYLGFCSSCPSSPWPDTLKEGNAVKPELMDTFQLQQVWSSLFGLERVFVGPCRVPSLALFATLCVIHSAPVVLAVTHHTDIYHEGKPSS